MSFWNGYEWVADTPPTITAAKPEGRVKHIAKAVLEAGLITALTFGLIAGSAFAAKGGGKHGGSGSGGTLAGPLLVHDNDGSQTATYGDDITFSVSTSASKPQVGLRCWQGSSFVYDGYVAFFDSWLSAPYFTLSSNVWGADSSASCTARLFVYDRRGNEQLLADPLTFTVAP